MTDESPKTVADLVRVTGLNKDTIKACIRTGTLPGYYTGTRYVIPSEAFDRFCRGEWVPQFRPVFTQEIKPIPSLIKRRQSA